jgi:putative thioredoxin
MLARTLLRRPLASIGVRSLCAGVKSPDVFDVTKENFAEMVMKNSRPVILDCHAEWRGPCKQLGPVLEAAVKNSAGRLVLAKLDTDAEQELAAGLQIKSLPTVFGVFEGKMVDQFMGLEKPARIQEFCAKLLAMMADEAGDLVELPEEVLVKAAATLEEGESEAARELYASILSEDSTATDTEKARAMAGCARCALSDGEADAAADVVGALQKQFPKGHVCYKHEDVASVISAVSMAAAAPDAADGAKLRERVETDPNDFEARHDLALLLVQETEYEEAIEHLLQIVKKDKGWNEGAAPKQLIQIFDSLGPSHPIAKAGRQRLTNFLFM